MSPQLQDRCGTCANEHRPLILPNKFRERAGLGLGQTFSLALDVQDLELSRRLRGQPAPCRLPQRCLIHTVQTHQFFSKWLGEALISRDRCAQDFQNFGFQRSIGLLGALLESSVEPVR